MVVCSAYLPCDSGEPSPTKDFEEIVHYCETENLHLVTGCDSNAHHNVWGGTNCNERGVTLVEFLNATNLEILNQGNDPTFYSGHRLEVTDITLGSFGLLGSIKTGRFHQNAPCRTTDILCSLYRAPYRHIKSGTPEAPNGTPFERASGLRKDWRGALS